MPAVPGRDNRHFTDPGRCATIPRVEYQSAASGAVPQYGTEVVADLAVLVRAAQAGDASALDQLIAAHLGLVYNIVGRALNGHADVDDLVQETMLWLVRGLPELRQPERFRSWLVAIAYRQIQQHLRDQRRTLLRTQGIVLDMPIRPVTSPSAPSPSWSSAGSGGSWPRPPAGSTAPTASCSRYGGRRPPGS